MDEESEAQQWEELGTSVEVSRTCPADYPASRAESKVFSGPKAVLPKGRQAHKPIWSERRGYIVTRCFGVWFFFSDNFIKHLSSFKAMK